MHKTYQTQACLFPDRPRLTLALIGRNADEPHCDWHPQNEPDAWDPPADSYSSPTARLPAVSQRLAPTQMQSYTH